MFFICFFSINSVFGKEKSPTNNELKKATADYQLAKKKYDALNSKYNSVFITGKIQGINPFIVYGQALGMGSGGMYKGYIEILNPNTKSTLLAYGGEHYFVKTRNSDTGVKINVYGSAPKDLETLKTNMNKTKTKMDALIAKEKQKEIAKNTTVFSNGDKYIGKLKNGKMDGSGTYIYKDGDKYVGLFKNGKFEGNGTYIYKDGDKYVGQFKNGKFEGKGILYNSDGSIKYDGQFKNDEFDGDGTFYFANSELFHAYDDKYVGQFKDGKFEGNGTLYNPYGSIKYEGEWLRGEPKQ